MLLKEDVMEILPSIEEANSISEEMDKKVEFEAVIVSPEARGVIHGRSEVGIWIKFEKSVNDALIRLEYQHNLYIFGEVVVHLHGPLG